MVIKISKLTKTFANGKGIFDLNCEVRQGEVLGYLGPNGAGKSTTIRHLMGFVKPTQGKATINGLDCSNESAEIQKKVGYLPGEIAFLDGMNGTQILELLGKMRGMKSISKRNQLIERFQFDPKTPIRKMSKGMKQKVGIVAAFMHDPDILILDEPTSGLDPLMQNLFVELILEEKQRGKTIFMSSHLFDEIERTCDRVAIIKDGRFVAVEDVQWLQSMQRKVFHVTLKSKEHLKMLRESGLQMIDEDHLSVSIAIQGNYDQLVRALAKCEVAQIDIVNQKLEDVFMHFYDRRGHVQ
ncbi:MAG: transporter ATP-binding protein [Sporolactobacillus laevolacticus]|nr:transporter ATP-binding protein [Sporolactobacillus laevolacticus]